MTATGELRAALEGRYSVEREIGAGGMAAVYLADDVRHGRKVAIKVLHPELSAVLGADRFLTEIRTTAKLQHPHILPLFDSGTANGLLYYVMPFVDGETLRGRLERETQLPVADAVRIATEVADALEYAHTQGVIHRDIKPENILLHGGHALVADFGIALAVEQAGGTRMTQTGLSLGTPQYMAPEQAMGDKNVGPRADVYALGAVTYEMLAGEPPFTGPNAQSIVAKVITEHAPSVAAHRRAAPASVDAAVARALEKVPADRFASAREFAEALAHGGTTTAPVAHVRMPSTKPWVLAGGLVAALAIGSVGGAMWMARRQPAPLTARLTLALPAEQLIENPVGSPAVLSPDGSALVYLASPGPGKVRMLFYRPLDALSARPLPGTEGAAGPFFSPDGQWIGFFANEGLTIKKVSVNSGGASLVAAVGPHWAGGAWARDNWIIAGSEKGLVRVPASGGKPELITHVDSVRAESYHAMPYVFPDGDNVAFDVDRSDADIEGSRIGIVSLRSGRTTTLDVSGRNPVGFIDGHLVVGRLEGGVPSLVGIPFDPKRWRVTGPAIPLLADVVVKENGGAEASLANNGSLVYLRGTSNRKLSLVDARGIGMGDLLAPSVYSGPRFSRDGRHVAVEIDKGVTASQTTNLADVWVYDVASRALSRVTSLATASAPEWMPDNRHIAYVVYRESKANSELWQAPFDASAPEELLYKVPSGFSFRSGPTISPDGSVMVIEVMTTSAEHELWKITRSPSGTWQGASFLRAPPYIGDPNLSPDGRWLAYDSRETGAYEVYVRPFPGPGGCIQVSAGGGFMPRWSADGKQLYYLSGRQDARLMSASLTTSPSLEVTRRGPAFPDAAMTPLISNDGYAPRPDGKGFAIVTRADDAKPEIVVALNWRAELARKIADATRR